MTKTQKEKKGFWGKHKKKIIVLVVIVVIAALAIVAVPKLLMPKNIAASTTNTSFTTTVKKMDIQNSVSVTGTLAAKESVSVTSTLTGVKVKAVNCEVGDYVEEGTVVAEFDGADLEDKVADLDLSTTISNKRSNHTIENYQEQIAELEEYLEEYKAGYQNALSLKEDKKLYYDTDPEFRERYDTEVKSVGGNIDTYISGYEDKLDQLKEAQYNLEIAKLERQQTKNNQDDEYESVYQSIDDAKVKAPISGYITAINVSEGNNYSQGSTVFSISNTDTFVVEATVDEYSISSLEKGMECVVKFDATDDQEFKGELTFVAIAPSSATSSNGMTGSSSSSSSYSIKIELKESDEKLRAGMTAKASVVLESAKDVLAVPYDCVHTDKDGNSYVTVVDGETETNVTVTRGMENDYYVEIQSSEITEGTKVLATASSNSSTDSTMPSMDGMPGGFTPGGGDFGGGGSNGFGGGGAPSGGFSRPGN